MEFANNHQITDLRINFNSEGWGPTSGERLAQLLEQVPYAHFDKKEKVGRTADFVFQQFQQQSQSQGSFISQKQMHYARKREEHLAAIGTTDFSYKHDAIEDSTFQLVDSTKLQSRNRRQNAPSGRFTGGGRGSGTSGGRVGMQTGRGGMLQQSDGFAAQGSLAKAGGILAGGRGISRGKHVLGRGFRKQDRKADRLPSLVVGGEWDMIEEFDLVHLLKLVANPPVIEDLAWHGHIDRYDDSYDKISTRIAKGLRRIDNKVFYDVTTSEDPILERLAVENVGDVYATDSIIAQLMAAPRSVYSWDIVVEKVNGIIFLDKREVSSFDYLTVSETAHEPPQATADMDEINHPDKLSMEATMINQNFTQQVLSDAEDSRKTYEVNPFFDEIESGVEPASAAYRYRKFTLGNVRLVARCELQSWITKHGEDVLMTCHALNEWDSKYSGGVNWRQKIDTQKGAVLATELKNNSCKLAKWTAQALLAGAQQLKLGYVSRVTPTNPYEHVVLGTQSFKPKDLAQQINLSINNIWGIVKMICELLLSKADGKYVLLKDPNKAIVRLYKVPLNTFEEEEEGNPAEDDEENEDKDDSENEISPIAAVNGPEIVK
eukprot:CAMPEP_0201109842 /NCGR_PEP_ID=MMETSP0812-20130820/67985_1 /ASSEMBLY_ACC=CAM_ASM_000668 /TAXON_ID=98059 /ORGANISM="Dinobryon sp., Strain UTEXLB2267" /LENGTH=603 /DNA_ID=CAMNT_0047372013 /DNA_START=11 /DNA_END=1822 /DNA_ORIENTATION=+